MKLYLLLISSSLFLFSCRSQHPEAITFDPIRWSQSNKLDNNNCYSYAIGNDVGMAYDPGYLSGYEHIKKLSAADIIQRSEDDGLKFVSSPDICQNSYAVALALDPNGTDYHWYRQDAGGFWSHKPGKTPITNTDNSGNLIRNPANINRGRYVDFVGYFCVPPKN